MYQSQGGYPQGGYPQTGYPQGAYPQPGYTQGGYPQAGYPQAGYPQAGYPQAGYPQAGYPQGGYAQDSYPLQDYSQGSPASQPPPSQTQYGRPGGFGEDGDDRAMDFSEQSIRRGFIRKVYSILMCQLLVTMGFIALFLFHEPTKQFVARNTYLFWVAFIILFVCLIAMACCTEVRRQTPMNFIFLGLFTVAQSFVLGIVTSTYNASEVMIAVGATAAVCLGLTLFAFQTKWDFTMMGGALVAATMVLLIFGIIAIFIPASRTVTLVYASAGVIIFSLYLVYDTQLMMGGKHKYSISPEEYIFAALNLYLDIVNIFLYILTIIGASK